MQILEGTCYLQDSLATRQPGTAALVTSQQGKGARDRALTGRGSLLAPSLAERCGSSGFVSVGLCCCVCVLALRTPYSSTSVSYSTCNLFFPSTPFLFASTHSLALHNPIGYLYLLTTYVINQAFAQSIPIRNQPPQSLPLQSNELSTARRLLFLAVNRSLNPKWPPISRRSTLYQLSLTIRGRTKWALSMSRSQFPI